MKKQTASAACFLCSSYFSKTLLTSLKVKASERLSTFRARNGKMLTYSTGNDAAQMFLIIHVTAARTTIFICNHVTSIFYNNCISGCTVYHYIFLQTFISNEFLQNDVSNFFVVKLYAKWFYNASRKSRKVLWIKGLLACLLDSNCNSYSYTN